MAKIPITSLPEAAEVEEGDQLILQGSVMTQRVTVRKLMARSVDGTLSEEGKPADAKAVGRMLGGKVGIICSTTEPEERSVLWLNENWRNEPRPQPENYDMLLKTGEPTGNDEITVEIDGEPHRVLNAAVNAGPTADAYNFTIL